MLRLAGVPFFADAVAALVCGLLGPGPGEAGCFSSSILHTFQKFTDFCLQAVLVCLRASGCCPLLPLPVCQVCTSAFLAYQSPAVGRLQLY